MLASVLYPRTGTTFREIWHMPVDEAHLLLESALDAAKQLPTSGGCPLAGS